jgi:hypothetical protein
MAKNLVDLERRAVDRSLADTPELEPFTVVAVEENANGVGD